MNKKIFIGLGAAAIILLLVFGALVIYRKNSQSADQKSTAALTEKQILTAAYSIGANSAGEMPSEQVVFPARTSEDGQWLPGITGTVFAYKDGTTSAHTLVGGKDYEAFWIYKYKLSPDRSMATVYISGNLAGDGNDNRTFLVRLVNGNVVAQEQEKGNWQPDDLR